MSYKGCFSIMYFHLFLLKFIKNCARDIMKIHYENTRVLYIHVDLK